MAGAKFSLSSSLSTSLNDHILPDIRLGKEIGRGANGRVLEAEWGGRKVAVKEIHSIFTETDTLQFQSVKEYFERECSRCLHMSHPNIVMFHGIYFPPRAVVPSLVMERLHCNLTDYLLQEPRILIDNKLLLMIDVAHGLKYLHSSVPPIIHRDLSSNNVLISKGPQLVAKIGDLGTSRFVDPRGLSQMSRAPGTVDFMPPEALSQVHSHYGVKIDVFSFGCVMLHTLSHEWPTPTEPVIADPVTGELKAQSETKRRCHYFDCIMHGVDKSMSDTLISLIKSCLNNVSKDRPSIAKVNKQLEYLAEKDDSKVNPNLLSPVITHQIRPRSSSANTKEAVVDENKKTRPNSMPIQSEPAAALISRGKFPSWFHGMMTRKQAEERLNSAPNGSFLIRFSQSQFGYSLSHRTTGCCKHYLIKRTTTGKYVFKDVSTQYSTLEDLVDFYQKNPINVDGDYLKLPCVVEECMKDQGCAKKVNYHHRVTHAKSQINFTYTKDQDNIYPPPLPPRSRK